MTFSTQPILLSRVFKKHPTAGDMRQAGSLARTHNLLNMDFLRNQQAEPRWQAGLSELTISSCINRFLRSRARPSQPRSHQSLHPQGQPKDPQKPFGIALIVGTATLHRSNCCIVKALRALPALDQNIAFIEV